MRNYTNAILLVTIASISGACCSSGHSKSSTNTPPPAGAAAQPANSCVMRSAGRDVLQLTLSSDATCKADDGALHLRSKDGYVDVWYVRGARTIDDGVARIPQQITSEFHDFKPKSTSTPTIAGNPAKQLKGSGSEADDGDPGSADVVIFKAGDSIFIACTHGESLAPSAERWMLAVLQTAQAR